MVVDCHTHIFCWGERPAEGFLSPRVRRSPLVRLLLRLTRLDDEPGADRSARLRHRYLRELSASGLDRAVCLAQDLVYRYDGTPDTAATHFHVANDYVLDLARDCPRIIPGCSVNPWRADALAELERVRQRGCRLVKVHTCIQGVDPADARHEPYYRQARDLGIVLMFHTGYEHSAPVVDQAFANPARLARPLDAGVTVIAAHCGTCARYDPEDYYGDFVAMMGRYDSLYGDTSILTALNRGRRLAVLAREDAALRARLLHGSDYPLQPSRLTFLPELGRRAFRRWNPLDLDLAIKRCFDWGPGYEDQVLDLLGQATTKGAKER